MYVKIILNPRSKDGGFENDTCCSWCKNKTTAFAGLHHINVDFANIDDFEKSLDPNTKLKDFEKCLAILCKSCLHKMIHMINQTILKGAQK